jgi:CheY-like chemotaxis protein
MAQARLNLKSLVVLIVDRDAFTRGLLSQMLRGFGVETVLTANTGAETKELLDHHCPDICLIEGELPDLSCPGLIGWIRHHRNPAVHFVPIIVMSGYTQMRLVSAARDGGAHMVVRKPLSPQTLFDRLAWVASSDRAFLEAPNYVGPDRRFHSVSPSKEELKREGDRLVEIEANP